jgi:predicted anti-sigma-YlaC factor YlaD
MLTCKQASQLLSQSLDRPLPLTNRIKLRLHLVICDACKRFSKQMHVLKTALQRLKLQTESDYTVVLSEAAKARINHTIASEQQ